MNRLAAIAVVLAGLIGCRPASSGLPDLGAVPDFRLTDQNGRTFNGKSLAGKVWVASFMFTNCMGPCPRMTSRLHEVQEASGADVQLVSMTIDPKNDTPVVLADYAKEHGASPERWHFLTGPQPVLHNLSRNVFKLGDVDGTLTHSTRFVLVDRKLQIRGYYDSFDPESVDRLIKDIKAVAREQAG